MNNHNAEMTIIKNIIEEIKSTETYQDLCKKFNVDKNFIDNVPIRFGKIDTSARTEQGIITLNENLLKKPKEIGHYLIHEFTHYLDQCLGEQATEGSNNSDDYLNNEFEQDGFQNQTKFISETKNDEEAKKYVEKVLDHHNVKEKEKPNKRKKLLRLASLL